MDGDKNTLTHLHVFPSSVPLTRESSAAYQRERRSRLEPVAEAAYLVTALTFVSTSLGRERK